MAEPPATRKQHITRIVGTNRAGERVDDIFLDVLRIDEETLERGQGPTYQKTVRRNVWFDDPDSEDGYRDEHPTRKTTILKICSPDETNPDDPDEWVPVAVIDRRESIERGGERGQGVRARFDNTNRRDAREVWERRVIHRDTSIDAKASAAFAADPERKTFVVPYDRYTMDDGSKDTDQYVEVEYVRWLDSALTDMAGTGQGGDQGKQLRPDNKFLLEGTEVAKLDRVGANGVNPPWRFDPDQAIVNVQWRVTQPKYAVMYGFAGDLGVLVLFDVDENSRLYRRVQLASATSSHGWTMSLGVGPGDTNDTPGPEVATPVTVIELDWKGNMRAGCFGSTILYDAGINGSFISLAEQAFYDVDGHTISGLPTPPAKGTQKNGLWVTTDSVASYTGDTLDWKLDIDVYEVLPGGKVLGASFETGLFGVYTLNPETGAITHFRKIGNDSDAGYNYDFDTSSNGDTYWMKNVDSGASAGATTVQRIDKDGVIVWEKLIGGPTNVANGIKGPGDRSIAVVENHGQVFFITHDQGAGYGPDRFPGSSTPDQPFNDVFVMAFDSNGNAVSRVKWGTNINSYVTGVDETFATTGGVIRRMIGADSTPRYPAPAS